MNSNISNIRIFSCLTAAIFLLLSVIISNCYIQVNTYDYSDNKSEICRIVLISDLHGREFGKNNNRLIDKIISLKPDIVCLAGDFIDEDNISDENAEFIGFLNKISAISPVYYSYGNHDLGYYNKNGFSLLDDIRNTGCIILEEGFVDIDINNTHIRLGGMFDYAFNQQYIPEEEWHKDSTFEFLKEFTDTERTKILLCHRPESFIYEDASFWNIDYVLCGHTHGGLWRLPFIGGIIAPEQGFNPEYDKGEYVINNIKMIISSGLSGYKKIPRMFNCPEITVIDF